MLDVLDPDTDLGRVYRALTRHGRCGAERLAGHTGLPAADVGRALTELADLDVVVRVDGDTWAARSPGLVLAELLRAEEARRERLWRAGAELDRLYHHARRDAGDGVLAVPDPLELIALTRDLQERATDRIRWLDRPPYRSRQEDFLAQEELQTRRMAAGLRYRAVYHQAVYSDPDLFASMTRMVGLGEDARVLADLPVKLTIGDDDTALLVPDPDGTGLSGALAVRTPGLVTALAGVFETLWTLGVPLTSGGADEPLSEPDRAIVTLLAAGVTDDVIARRLRLSRRTVVRRVAALLDRLGATTRFQAGVQAAHRGWL
ncbi:LuxR C-terminal-related transcriptional regulator [Actinophytocola gossypii]|uniref:Transcriptional regulator n=1 Tax=Actinophytocola gossypii TaxID=2812003 RepID=A0ABT2JE35_9PSEU|nr:transcriptional regulator [Actinophytocola gossypii]MCT2585534.1 transcriptional regulator [Actinophytocola gossypii]